MSLPTSSLTRLGVSENQTQLVQKRIQIMNVCSLIIVTTALFFLAFDAFTGHLTMARGLVMTGEFFFFSAVLFVHKEQKYTISKWIFISSIFILIFIHSNFFFLGFYGEYQYLSIPLFALLLFDHLAIHLSFLMLSIAAFYLPNMILNIYPDAYFGYLNVVFIFIGEFLIVNFFRRINNRNEKVLEDKQVLLEKAYTQLDEQRKNELALAQLKALKSQMNPHFIFNGLNSIQNLVLKEDVASSYDSISLFANLTRQTLTYSDKDWISLADEVSFLKNYLQLEKLRFNDSFQFEILLETDPDWEIPPLILQPFVENAVKHGLFHKSGEKELRIRIFFQEKLTCTIEDNGVGLKKAEQINSRQHGGHESFSLGALRRRMILFGQKDGKQYQFELKDRTEGGTLAEINIPYQEH